MAGIFFMHYVYILKSIHFSSQTYVGSSADIKDRLISHNSGANKHTTKFKPWKLIWFCCFANKDKAIAFEKYLKTASGIAFRRKRLIWSSSTWPQLRGGIKWKNKDKKSKNISDFGGDRNCWGFGFGRWGFVLSL